MADAEMVLVHHDEVVVHRGDLDEWRRALHAALGLMKNSTPESFEAWENGRQVLREMARYFDGDAPG